MKPKKLHEASSGSLRLVSLLRLPLTGGVHRQQSPPSSVNNGGGVRSLMHAIKRSKRHTHVLSLSPSVSPVPLGGLPVCVFCEGGDAGASVC